MIKNKLKKIISCFLFSQVLLVFNIFTSGCGSTSENSVSDTAYYQSGGTVELSGQTYSSAVSDENAVKVYSSGIFTLSDSTITKIGDTASENNSNFYGINAGVLAASVGTISLTNCSITTDASGANAVFAYGSGSSVTLDNVSIETSSNSSRDVDATYGGTISISNSEITTTGDHCAALATDRYDSSTGAPEVNADNCTGNTAGDGSPGLYCTGTFTVSDSTFTATGSEAAVIEGLNSITLTNTSISGAEKWGVMIYQSTSGDASVGTGTFTMTEGTLTNNYSEGPLFFVCNTDAIITLDGVTISNSSDMLLIAGTADAASSVIDNVNSDWGTDGGTVTLTVKNMTFSGEIIICDTSSSIILSLENSTFSGSINNSDINCTVEVTIDADSTWEVTGDSYLSSLTNSGTISSGTYTVYED